MTRTARSARSTTEIPAELATVIDRLLAKEPGKRIQTSAKVAEILEQLLARQAAGMDRRE